MSSEPVVPWLTVTNASAVKLGRNGGEVGFRVLRNPTGDLLAITITANSGGGCWSPEIISLENIESCLPDDRQELVSAKVFANAFKGRSANNGPFATAVLLSLGFLTRATEHPNRYQVADRWSSIKAELLSLEAGEPYVPPMKPDKVATSAMTRQDMPGEAEADDVLAGRKGRKNRPVKHVVQNHNHAATGQ